ncbi:MAG: 4Fe-4S dicluster domain-containing protein [Sulfuritalea sp.]|nr:4Fe-4S dicluster domain-containing protein [Sulfuritalea sp.]
MAGLFVQTVPALRDYSACSGCSLCFLVCPMWRARRDPRFSPEGLAKALQCGATAVELAAPLEACSLCGACDPVCPERIDLSGMIIDLRPALPHSAEHDATQTKLAAQAAGATAPAHGALLLPGPELRANPSLLARVQALLGYGLTEDDGADIAQALEVGIELPPARRRRFLNMLEGRSLTVSDGLLLRQLRRWLPGARLQSLGEALSSLRAIRSRLTSADFYVIEPRAYHSDYERLVAYYDCLRQETGCAMNLDLQRIAIPALTQRLERRHEAFAEADLAEARWMLKGRQPGRIVVESLADRAMFERVCDVPVLHLAEVAEN